MLADGTYKVTARGLRRVNRAGGYWIASEELASLADARPGDYVGVWTDPATGKLWLDRSHHVSDLAAALELGKVWRQIAVWDCKAGQAVTVPVEVMA